MDTLRSPDRAPPEILHRVPRSIAAAAAFHASSADLRVRIGWKSEAGQNGSEQLPARPMPACLSFLEGRRNQVREPGSIEAATAV